MLAFSSHVSTSPTWDTWDGWRYTHTRTPPIRWRAFPQPAALKIQAILLAAVWSS